MSSLLIFINTDNVQYFGWCSCAVARWVKKTNEKKNNVKYLRKINAMYERAPIGRAFQSIQIDNWILSILVSFCVVKLSCQTEKELAAHFGCIILFLSRSVCCCGYACVCVCAHYVGFVCRPIFLSIFYFCVVGFNSLGASQKASSNK